MLIYQLGGHTYPGTNADRSNYREFIGLGFAVPAVVIDGIVVHAENEFIAVVSSGVGEYVYVSRGDEALLRQFDVGLRDGELILEPLT